ncbi:MAG: hypothetical protein FJ137_19745, partial [Deltaproteobacteria bacterium]|nr:hypothetical protein [Deltaproteobacteria bacterium]
MSPVILALAIPSLTLSPTTLVTDEDTGLEATLAADAADARFSLAREPRRGAATLNEKTGALRYVPQRDFAGSDKLRIEVRADGKVAVVELTIKVTPVNDPPTVAALRLSTREDRPAEGALRVDDVDRDKPSFTV